MGAKKKEKPGKKIGIEELEKRLGPEERKLYRRIEKIRESIGPVSTNVADLVREIRGDGD
jgi:hypothetical protein